jgi:hypothetical protein
MKMKGVFCLYSPFYLPFWAFGVPAKGKTIINIPLSI